MTSLYKLKIQGIRSYAPDEEAVIQFYKPLTIIVGANGTGKTTIIEALRYASCGQLPPDATRGIGFVHDLDRAGSASVKGKVSLAFKTAEPVLDCVVHRYMQVTQTKTKRSFKSLDSTICITNEHGEVWWFYF
jgi:DNA repair protein RAD50